MAPEPIPPTLDEFWDAIHALANAHGAAPINQFPGLWEIELHGSAWKLTANGHRETLSYHGRAGIPFQFEDM